MPQILKNFNSYAHTTYKMEVCEADSTLSVGKWKGAAAGVFKKFLKTGKDINGNTRTWQRLQSLFMFRRYWGFPKKCSFTLVHL